MKNLCSKTRKVTAPYEVWQCGNWFWVVLKKWQSPDKEAANKYARWYCAAYTPMTYGSYDVANLKPEGSCDYGDVYVAEIKANATCVYRDPALETAEEASSAAAMQRVMKDFGPDAD